MLRFCQLLTLWPLRRPELLQIHKLSYTGGKHIPAGVRDVAIDPAAHAVDLLDLRVAAKLRA